MRRVLLPVLLLLFAGVAEAKKGFYYNFTIPDLEAGDGGRVVGINDGQTVFDCGEGASNGGGSIDVACYYNGTVWKAATSACHESSSAPAVSNDIDTGFPVGARWCDITADRTYISIDASDGAAVWLADPDHTISSTSALTGKSYDAEGTGNVLTLPVRWQLPVAACNGTTAGPRWNLFTSAVPEAVCVTGPNGTTGVLGFDDGVVGAAEYAQVTLELPGDWTGSIDVDGKWYGAAIVNEVRWLFQTACYGDGETRDPAWNTANSVDDTAKGTTLQSNDFSMSSITTTGCNAGEAFRIRIGRDADNAADDFIGVASSCRDRRHHGGPYLHLD